MADKVKRKKKKHSRRRYLIIGAVVGIIYIIVGSVFAAFLILRANEASKAVSTEPSALSSYAPTSLIYRVENRIYRMNMDTLESEQVAVVRGVASDDEDTLETLQLSHALDMMHYVARQSDTEHVLMRQDVSTGQVWELSSFRSWSQIISSSTGDVLVYILDNEYSLDTPKIISQDNVIFFYLDWSIYEVTWAEDGSYFVLNLAFDDPRYPNSVFQPFDKDNEWSMRIRPDGQDRFYINVQDVNARDIHISSDDEFIAMNGRSVSENTLEGLWITEFSIETEIPTYLSQTSDYINGFSWSPDSQWIAYAGYQSTQFDILAVNIETKEIINLTETLDMDEHNPNWLPNGDIIFEREGQLWRTNMESEVEALPATEGAVYMGYRIGQ